PDGAEHVPDRVSDVVRVDELAVAPGDAPTLGGVGRDHRAVPRYLLTCCDALLDIGTQVTGGLLPDKREVRSVGLAQFDQDVEDRWQPRELQLTVLVEYRLGEGREAQAVVHVPHA